MTQPLFISMSVSPWSERARFALDHHHIAYRKQEYTPMLGEPLLRLRLRKFRGLVSVPVLIHDGGAILDSVDIARYSDRVGSGSPLFPAEAEAEISRFLALSNALMDAGRALALPRMAQDPQARKEGLPRGMPAPLRAVIAPMAGLGLAYLSRKYRLEAHDPNESRATMRRSLEQFREALRGRSTLLSDFTFADIAVAVALGGLKPVEHAALRIGPAMRAAFTDQALSEEFADLLAWRDRLYAERRSV